jgi:ubiquinone biosynthesis protein COQ9
MSNHNDNLIQFGSQQIIDYGFNNRAVAEGEELLGFTHASGQSRGEDDA